MTILKDTVKFRFAISDPNQLISWFNQNLDAVGFCFCGRSNVGKSSSINALFGKKTAQTSKTPGRTQKINIFTFQVKDNPKLFHFFDLPGYGYAKVSREMAKNWDELLNLFFNNLTPSILLLNIQDARHPLQKSDAQFIDYASEFDIPIYLILNKMDKLKSQKEKNTLEKIIRANKNDLKQFDQIFKISAEKRDGLDPLNLSLINFLSSHSL